MIARQRKTTLISLAAFIVTFVVTMIMNLTLDYKRLTFSSFFLVLTGLVTLLIAGYRLFSLPVLLTFFVYIFHFGQSVLDVIIRDNSISHLFLINSDIDLAIFLRAMHYSLAGLGFLILGALLMPLLVKQERLFISFNEATRLKCREDAATLKLLRNISIVLLCVSIPAMLYLDITKYSALTEGGYIATYEALSDGFIKYIAPLAMLGRLALILFMISLRNKKAHAQIVLYGSAIYYAISMLTGDRGTNAIYLLTSFAVYFLTVQNIRIKDFLRLCIVLILVVILITTVSTFRDLDGFNLESFIDALNARQNSGFLKNTIREFGATFETIYLTVKNYPSRTGFLGGLAFAVSPFYILPKLPNFTANWFPYHSFTKGFELDEQANLGGSILGESYANFGWFGVLWLCLVGVAIGYHAYTLAKAVNRKSWGIVLLLVAVYPYIVLWTRDYFVSIFNTTILVSVVIFIFLLKWSSKINNAPCNQEPHVCVIIGRLDYSGAEKIAVGLMNELVSRSYFISAILTATDKIENEYTAIQQYPIYDREFEKKNSRLIRTIKRIWVLSKTMRKVNADIFISFGAMTNVDSLIATQLTNYRIICCERSNPVYDPKSRVARVRRRLTYWLSDYFVFQTQEVASYFSYSILAKSIVIPNFVEKMKVESVKKHPQVITVARLSNDSKNHLLLIKAFARFSDNHPEYELVFCGDGPDKDLYLRVASELGVADKTFFLGRCDNPIHHVNKAEIFVLSSLYEGMPNALLEAMASGAACISTDCYGGGARAIITDGVNGIIVPNNDFDALANAIHDLTEDKVKSEKFRVEAKKISQQFSIKNVVDKWEEILRYSICG